MAGGRLAGDIDFAQSRLDGIDDRRPVVAVKRDWPASFENSPHFHNRCQLVYGSKGILHVLMPESTWIVPPQRAVWIPAGIPHVIRTGTAVALRSVYFDAALDSRLPKDCRVLNVSSLLRELLLKATQLPTLYPLGGREERLMQVLVDELLEASTGVGALQLPEPKDPRMRVIVKALLKNPADPRTREDWAASIGASSRTIDRVFSEETDMSFGRWKRQAILLEAMRRLAAGESVTNVAFDLGYGSPSAFIAMFRRTLGITPNKFFK